MEEAGQPAPEYRQNDAQLESLLNVISSAVGSLTNPKKLEDTFTSSGTGKLSAVTVMDGDPGSKAGMRGRGRDEGE